MAPPRTFIAFDDYVGCRPQGLNTTTPEWSNPGSTRNNAEKEALVGAGDLENDRYRFRQVCSYTTTTNVKLV